MDLMPNINEELLMKPLSSFKPKYDIGLKNHVTIIGNILQRTSRCDFTDWF